MSSVPVALLVPGHSLQETCNFSTISPTQAISGQFQVLGTQIGVSLTQPLALGSCCCIFWVDETNGQRFLGYIDNEKPSVILSVLSPIGQVGLMVESLQFAQQQTVVNRDVNVEVALHVAQRILTNFFDYASGFVSNVMGKEVLPMKSLMDWYNNTQERMKKDPSWLLRGFQQ